MSRTLPLPRSITAAVAGAVLISGVGLATAASNEEISVLLTLDGVSTEIPVRGDTVADLLSEQGLQADEHDFLAPAPDTELENGDRVSLRRAVEVELVVDGEPTVVHVIADDLAGALRQAGLSSASYTSASRSRPLVEGLSVDVRTPKPVFIAALEVLERRTTTALTVGDALAEVGIEVTEADRVSPAVDTVIEGPTPIKLIRRIAVAEELTVKPERQADDSMFKGQTKTLRAGVPGLARVVYDVATVAPGKTERTKVASTTVRAPQPGLVAFGTKPKPKPVSSGPVFPDSPDGLNWPALARCESGGNPSIVSPNGLYHGLYQFNVQTWRSVGGTGLPSRATPAEQLKRAKILYSQRGRQPWPHCGKFL